jgi:poly(A) polymerase
MCDKLGIDPMVDDEPVQAQIAPFGSYLLGVCSPSSDIDVLCIFPSFIKRSHFFQTLGEILLSAKDKVHDLMKIENAVVPIMTMKFDGIEIDLSFAALNMKTIPPDIDLSDDTLLNTQDVAGANSLNGRRTNEMMMQLIPNKEDFGILLRFIRIWASARAIYGNVYGYLGGVNCALLCAFTCQRYPNACPATLVAMLFGDLAEWPWPTPIYINTPSTGPLDSWNPALSSDWMPIITPAYPAINSLRSASRSTRQRMVDEFKRGFEMTNNVILKGKKWTTVVANTNFFMKYGRYVQIKVFADTEKGFNTWIRTVEAKIKKLSISLESLEHVESSATYPDYFETPNDEGHRWAGSFFLGLNIEKPVGDEKPTVDISPETKRFLTDLNAIPDRQAPWLAKPLIVLRKDLPLYVYPDGVRPQPKPPQAKLKPA